jgi:hypothetical protein
VTAQLGQVTGKIVQVICQLGQVTGQLGQVIASWVR